ncbi:MAG: modification methylase, partial [Candidatus Sumerlaeota bacterium]
MDFDPLAVFISKAKTAALSTQQLAEVRKYWSGKIGAASHEDLSDAVPNLYHWFRPEIAKQLAFIKRKALRIEDEAQKLFSLVVFSSIIRRVSNADDQTQKTYVSGTLKKTPPSPCELFPAFLDKAVRGMGSYATSRRAPVIVERGDARNWRSPKKLDGIITSPP